MVVLRAFAQPTDGVRHQQDSTEAHVQTQVLGAGTLYITESQVSWLGVGGQGFTLDYPSISLHAVSRDTATFPQECLYLMVDADLDADTKENREESSSDEENDGCGKVTDVRFVPSDKTALDAMFSAMSECQSLHPDPEDSMSDEFSDAQDEDNGDSAIVGDSLYSNQAGTQNLTPEGQATLQRLEHMLARGMELGQGEATSTAPTSQPNGDDNMDMGQFEDADS